MLQRFKKPEYYFNYKSILKRISRQKDQERIQTIHTPWKTPIECDIHESIGHAIYQTGIYDLSITEVLWRLVTPGSFVLDIGANIGYTLGICSLRAGEDGDVWAFEPNPLITERLRKNISALANKNVKLFSLALSDEPGEASLQFPEAYGQNEGTAFIDKQSGNETSVKVQLETLDNIIGENKIIKLIKIDVEGHELSVFKGAEKLLKNKCIQNIVYEDHLDYPSSVSIHLLNAGYTIFRIEKGWRNVCLKDPGTKSHLSAWEAANFLATLEPDFVKKQVLHKAYLSIRNIHP